MNQLRWVEYGYWGHNCMFYFVCITKDTQQDINYLSVLKNICKTCMSASIVVSALLQFPQLFHVTQMFGGIWSILKNIGIFSLNLVEIGIVEQNSKQKLEIVTDCGQADYIRFSGRDTIARFSCCKRNTMHKLTRTKTFLGKFGNKLFIIFSPFLCLSYFWSQITYRISIKGI